jgi:hypothetical protein
MDRHPIRRATRRKALAGLTPVTLLAALLAATMLAAPAAGRRHPLAAQTLAELTATPESTADLYLRSVRAIRWSAAAQFIHESTLARFDTTVTMIADADTTGAMRDYLVGTDSMGLAALDAAEVFSRAIGTMIDDMPGLMHSLYDRDDVVIGHVVERADTAHVVYRTTARISGAVSEVKVMQLIRSPNGWRVFWSDELEVLDAALRGVGRGRGRPPGPSPAHLPRQPQRHVQMVGRSHVAKRIEAERPEGHLDGPIAPRGATTRPEIERVNEAARLLEVE